MECGADAAARQRCEVRRTRVGTRAAGVPCPHRDEGGAQLCLRHLDADGGAAGRQRRLDDDAHALGLHVGWHRRRGGQRRPRRRRRRQAERRAGRGGAAAAQVGCRGAAPADVCQVRGERWCLLYPPQPEPAPQPMASAPYLVKVGGLTPTAVVTTELQGMRAVWTNELMKAMNEVANAVASSGEPNVEVMMVTSGPTCAPRTARFRLGCSQQCDRGGTGMCNGYACGPRVRTGRAAQSGLSPACRSGAGRAACPSSPGRSAAR